VETHDFVPAYLAANADVIAFNVEYRLAPEDKFPWGCRTAIRRCAGLP
jgi:acetyl esterase